MLEAAALFINGTRQMRNINVFEEDGKVKVQTRTSNKPIVAEYDIVEVASTAEHSMAWDATGEGTPSTFRLVAQVGCGCGGMKSYELDEAYSGRLGNAR